MVYHGTRPLDGIHFDLRDGSTNLGETDYEVDVDGRPLDVARDPAGTYRLYRIDDD